MHLHLALFLPETQLSLELKFEYEIQTIKFCYTDLASQLALLVWKLFPLPQCGKQRVLILLNHRKL